MIVSAEDFYLYFDTLKKNRPDKRKDVVFVSTTEADSLCSVRILQSIFQIAGENYSLNPVSTFEQLHERCKEELADSQDVRFIFLVNCGATLARECMPEVFETPDVYIIIMDCHRPIHHSHNGPPDNEDDNVFVVVDRDDPIPQSSIPPAVSEFDQDIDEEDEEEGGDSGSPGVHKRRRDYADALDPSRAYRRRRMDEDGSHSPGNSQDPNHETLRRKRIKELEDYYYIGSAYGKPTSLLLYGLADSRNLRSNHTLWLACIGLTDMYLFQRIDQQSYEQWFNYLNDLIKSLDSNQNMDNNIMLTEGGQVQAPKDREKLVDIEDFRFPLMRQWTLYESMQFSPYVAPRIRTWRQSGLGILDYLLVKMGYPQKQCHLSWGQMEAKRKDLTKLKEALEAHAAPCRLSIDQLVFKSFEYQVGWSVRWTAPDVVYALMGVLADPKADENEKFRDGMCMLDMHKTKEGTQKLVEGYNKAKSLLKAVIDVGGMVMGSKRLDGADTPGALILSTCLEEQRNPKVDHFQHPLTLVQLAFFLRDAMLYGPKNRLMPTVVVGPPDAEGYCQVVGIRSKQTVRRELQANIFGRAFADALTGARGTVVEVKDESFDHAVIKIPASEVRGFLERLRLNIELEKAEEEES